MTARTSELLAKELDNVGLTVIAKLARQDMFHDFLSEHATPVMGLVDMLVGAAAGCPDGRRMAAILHLRDRVVAGEFDADEAEFGSVGQERGWPSRIQRTGQGQEMNVGLSQFHRADHHFHRRRLCRGQRDQAPTKRAEKST